MKTFKKKIFAITAVVTTFVAAAMATSACFFWTYQPEEPKCLRED